MSSFTAFPKQNNSKSTIPSVRTFPRVIHYYLLEHRQGCVEANIEGVRLTTLTQSNGAQSFPPSVHYLRLRSEFRSLVMVFC
jgi:hypothetical protein